MRPASPDLGQPTSSARERALRGRRAADEQGIMTFSECRELAQQMMKLKHKPELPVPEFRRAARIESA